jgi:hypothetical protein
MKSQDIFINTLPNRPFCSNDLRFGLKIRPKLQAIQQRMIQPNGPLAVKWLLFDIDRDDSYFAFEERCAPVPSFIAVNKGNGHCHYGYMLRSAVTKLELSRESPIKFLDAVQRGLTRRLGADPAYTGLICKNPLSSDWCVEWNLGRPYELSELNDCLDTKDKQKPDKSAISEKSGRNVTVFDAVRHLAYRECWKFHKLHGGMDAYLDWLNEAAIQVNSSFQAQLPLQELHSICKSIFKWTWSRMTPDAFSELQRQRVLLRWHKKALIPDMVSSAKSEPWTEAGVSRRKWFYDKKKQSTLKSCNETSGIS